jgi:PKD repeat protein
MFGKNTEGDREWYIGSDEKKATLFYTSGETISAMGVWARVNYGNPKIRGVIYNQDGSLVAMTEEIVISETVLTSYVLPMSGAVNLPAGYYYLTVQIGSVGASAAIMISMIYSTPPETPGLENADLYSDGPSNPFGTATTTDHIFSIWAFSAEPHEPTAIFTGPSSAIVGQPLTFDATTSKPGFDGVAESPIQSYAWDFGDGQSQTVTAPTVTHIYSTEGNFTVTLIVTDSQPLSSTPASLPITIQSPPPAYGPTASFTITPSALTVTFDGTPSQPGWDGYAISPIAIFAWNFGDGTPIESGLPSTHAIRSHTYATSGTYQVTLTVTDGQPLSDSVTSSIAVNETGEVTILVDFEKDTDFLTGDGSLWEPSSLAVAWPQNKFSPSTLYVHSGLRSAKLELTDPSTNEGRRLELLHRWNPAITRDMWLEFWFFIPPDFPFSANDGSTFFRAVYERAFTPFTPADYVFQSWLGIYPIDGRTSRPTYGEPIFIWTRNQNFDLPDSGSIETRESYLSDLQQIWDSNTSKFIWDPAIPPEKRLTPKNFAGKWIGFRCYIYRDVDAWRSGNKNSGFYKLWVNTSQQVPPPEDAWQLLYEDNPIRTIGIDPDLLAQITDTYLRDGYFCCGFSNYCSIGEQPKALYFDDLVMSGVPLVPSVQHTLNILAGVGGATSPASGSYNITEGESVSVTAIPDVPDYRFVYWLRDGVQVTDNPIIIIMDADHTLEPVFEYVPPPPVTSTISGVVKDSITNSPIPAATVTCDGYADITETDGTYTFLSIPAQAYTLTITKEGFKTQTIPVDLSAGGTFTQDITLSPTPKASSMLPAALGLLAVAGILYLATRKKR